MELARYEKLQRELESARSERQKAEGALEQTLATMREEFGVTSVEQAKRLLAKEKRSAAGLEAELEKILSRLERDHGHRLG